VKVESEKKHVVNVMVLVKLHILLKVFLELFNKLERVINVMELVSNLKKHVKIVMEKKEKK
jgi:hypothetical protein